MTDEQIMNDIAEYRTLRSIVYNLIKGGRVNRDIKLILGQRLFERMVFLENSTLPMRIEQFDSKSINDKRF